MTGHSSRCDRFCDECGDCIDCHWDDVCYHAGKTHAEMYGGESMAADTPEWLRALHGAIPEPVTETVTVGGAEFVLRGLTARERDAFEQSIVDARGKKTKVNLENIRAKLLRRCIVSINGHTIPEDEASRTLLEVELGRRNAAEVNQLFEVAQRLSGLRPEDVEELAGN